MNNRMYILLLFSLSSFVLQCTEKIDPSNISVSSPGQQIRMQFSLIDGKPHQQLFFNEAQILNPSTMGFTFLDQPALSENLDVVSVQRKTINETWQPVWGQRSNIRNHYNQLKIHLKESTNLRRQWNIIFRVFDDGVAFRCEFPKQKNLDSLKIMSENTYFRFTEDHTCWWIPNAYDTYELLYSQTPLSFIRGRHNVATGKDLGLAVDYDSIGGVNTPLTMKTAKGLYLSMHEANLTDYAGMTLIKVEGTQFDLKSELVPHPNGVKVYAQTPFKTPWRTIMIGKSPGSLAESDLILNLNEPCVLDDVSWIQPMKYAGIWWGMHIATMTWAQGPSHGATTENAIHYIDFAVENDIKGVLIEGWNTGWESWWEDAAFDFTTAYDDFDIGAVVSYARERDVEIIGHHETGGNVPNYEKHLDKALQYYQRLGIRVVKTGYAGIMRPQGQTHHGQYMVRHYRRVVEKAAQYGIMIDAHEPIKDTGISRTWPNMMTREGVRGTEWNAWAEPNPPEHSCILPFTRVLSGPVDFTPGIFDLTLQNDIELRQKNGRGEWAGRARIATTLAHQLALYVVLYSPLQMVADLPRNYEGKPEFQFIRDVPTDWDESRVLHAEIGDHVTFVRKDRHSENWYLGSVTDENERMVLIPLHFLSPKKKYLARIYADGPDAHWEDNPYNTKLNKKNVSSTDSLHIRLAPGGGLAISFHPLNEASAWD